MISRLSRGLCDYPKRHPRLGELTPTPDRIAQALAGKDSLRIQPSGAYAANLLGLTEQVPAKVILLTDGTNRNITVGNQHQPRPRYDASAPTLLVSVERCSAPAARCIVCTLAATHHHALVVYSPTVPTNAPNW